ncbi:MAG: AEC family transporter [Rhodospirillales bacterium]
MIEIFSVALPVFGFVIGGFALGKSALLDEIKVKGLTAYVFWFAIPLLLFRGGSKLGASGGEGFEAGVLAAYFLASAAIYILAFSANWRMFGGKGAEPPLAAMTSAYGNSVMMGIPLAEIFFGTPGLAVATGIIACSAPLYYGISTFLIEARLGNASSPIDLAKETLLGILKTPVILAMAAGICFGLTGLEVHPIAERFIDTGAAAAAPTALFALGATLAGFKVAGDLAEAGTISALKLVLNPTLVWLLATFVFQMPLETVIIVTMMAALPCAVNPFLLASRYDAYSRRASAAIVLSTGISIVSIPVAVWLAG